MEESQILIIHGENDVIAEIQNEITELTGAKPVVSEKKNLSGVTEAITLVTPLITALVPVVLNFIKEKSSLNKVKKIKIGEIEIENPDKALIDAIAKKIEGK